MVDFSRALTGPIFGPIPNAKLKVFFPIEKINSQLKKLNIFLLKSIKSILNFSHAKHFPQASSMTYTHQIDCSLVYFTQGTSFTISSECYRRATLATTSRGWIFDNDLYAKCLVIYLLIKHTEII